MSRKNCYLFFSSLHKYLSLILNLRKFKLYIFLCCFFLSLNIYCKETYKMKQKDKQTNIFTNLHEKFVDLSEYICKKNCVFLFLLHIQFSNWIFFILAVFANVSSSGNADLTCLLSFLCTCQAQCYHSVHFLDWASSLLPTSNNKNTLKCQVKCSS